MQDRSATFLIVVWLAVVVFGSLLLNRPPAPVPASAPPNEFSGERAFAFIKDFAQRPHPMGTQEHKRVRDYLVAQITDLGLTPEIQSATGVTPLYQVAGRVENIAARLRGTSETHDAVMLAAHYDSVAAAPGAADDGAGVAALLETIRAVRFQSPLKNDVIFLFTDGEEEGMLGASAFVDQHPWAKSVRVAVNLDARGNGGDSQLFETSVGNARLVRLFEQAVLRSNGSSLSYEIYQHMPNDTDMTVFKRYGLKGLNFAFIGHWEAHHSPLDNADGLDRGSLQRHGQYAIGLVRSLGNADLTELRAPDAVFFSIPGGLSLSYPHAYVWPLAILAALAFFASCFHASRAYQTSSLGIFLGVLANLGILAILACAAFGFVRLVQWLHLHWLREGDIQNSALYELSLIAMLTALAIASHKVLHNKLSWSSLFLGGSTVLIVLSLLAARWGPGATYLLIWPLLASLLAYVFTSFNAERTSLRSTLVLCGLALPPLLLFVPTLEGIQQALGLTTLGALAQALTLGLLIFTIVPLLQTLLKLGGNWVLRAVFGASLLLFVMGAYITRYSSAHPKPSVIIYALDADKGKALWAAATNRLDSWTAQYVGNSAVRGKLTGFFPDWLPFQFFQRDAPVVSLSPPEMDVLENSVAGDVRTLRLRILSPRHARVVSVEVPGSQIIDGWVEDRKLGQPSDSRWNKQGNWAFDYVNPPADRIELRLQVKGARSVKLVILDHTIGLPEIPDAKFSPRPADSMPQGHRGDETIVRRTFILSAAPEYFCFLRWRSRSVCGSDMTPAASDSPKCNLPSRPSEIQSNV